MGTFLLHFGTSRCIPAMSVLIRSATLTHYPEVARAAGLDPRAMMRKVRLPLESLERPDMRIIDHRRPPAAGIFRRRPRASRSSACCMAERGALSNLGPVALIVREQATVGDALKALARFIHIHHEGMRLMIDRTRTSSRSPSRCAAACCARRAQSSEMALGSLHRIIRALAGDDWRPLEAHLTHRAAAQPQILPRASSAARSSSTPNSTRS